ncbi:MAG: hypothetical protein H0U67_01770 [Gemmatimonadetes bacterium]|nr:hypothetical protein [Gemmatimonadota bacterium]
MLLKILLHLSQENAVSIPGVLIVSASTGTGHRRAAEAVEDAFAETVPWLPVKHVDLLSLAPRWVRTAYGDGFELLATRAPRIWGEVYRRTDAASPDLARWGPLAHRMLFREFRKLLLSREWGACVCTHFLPGQLAAGGAGIPPFSMVITDLTLHHFWAQPRVGRYFVASERLAGELRARVPHAPVEATGIPVARAFAGAPSRAAARSELGIDPDRLVALVMGGGLGIGVEETAQAAAAALVPGLQTIAICGRNAEAAARLRRRWAGDDRVRVLGYVDTVERYIAAADIVVTKPGGLTTSEVLAIGRPLLPRSGGGKCSGVDNLWRRGLRSLVGRGRGRSPADHPRCRSPGSDDRGGAGDRTAHGSDQNRRGRCGGPRCHAGGLAL